MLGYASNKLTPLYVRQVTARAMRVSDRERQLGRTLPAIVVLPDSEELVQEFLKYMSPYLHEVRVAEEEKPDTDREWVGGGPRLQRFKLTDAQAGPETVTVSFLDGTHENVDSRYAAELAAHFAEANMPEVFRPRATAVFQRTIGDLLQRRPFDTFDEPSSSSERREATVEEQAEILQAKLKKLGGWWAIHGDIPVSHFNRLVNDAGGISDGKRPNASVAQLERALRFAEAHVRKFRNGGQ